MTVILTQQVGNDGKRRVCNATCHNARKPKCDCICGSKYHGIARGRKTPENIEQANMMKENPEGFDRLQAPFQTSQTLMAKAYGYTEETKE